MTNPSLNNFFQSEVKLDNTFPFDHKQMASKMNLEHALLYNLNEILPNLDLQPQGYAYYVHNLLIVAMASLFGYELDQVCQGEKLVLLL